MFTDTIVSQDADGQQVEVPLQDDTQVREHIMALDGRSHALVTIYGGTT